MSTSATEAGMSSAVEAIPGDALDQFKEELVQRVTSEVEKRFEAKLEEEREKRERAEAKADAAIAHIRQLKEQPTVEFRGSSLSPENLWIGNHPIGKLSFNAKQRSIKLEEQVKKLELGQVDAEEIVAAGVDEQLSIQRKTAERKSGTHNLKGNLLRATHVWPEFPKRAIREQGKMKLSSSQVKNIHREKDLSTNSNTIKRTMRMLAKHTGFGPLKDCDPEDDDNLVTFKQSSNKNMLVADQEEWNEFFATLSDELLEAETETQEGSEQSEEPTKDVSDEVGDNLFNATPVKSSDEDSVKAEMPDYKGGMKES